MQSTPMSTSRARHHARHLGNNNWRNIKSSSNTNIDMNNNNRISLESCLNANCRKIAQLKSQVQQLHDTQHWSLCSQTTDPSLSNDLRRRLDIIEREIDTCVKIIKNGLSQHVARPRQPPANVLVERLPPVDEESYQRRRQLDRDNEEWALQQAAREATERRLAQLQSTTSQMKTTKSSFNRLASSVSAFFSRRGSDVEHGDDLHRRRLSKKRKWLVDKVIAPSVAGIMFQNGAISLPDLELIRSSEQPSLQAEYLIDIVSDQPYAVFHNFKKALRQTKQDDVYEVLADIEFPVDAEHRDVIRQCYGDLLDNLDLKYCDTLRQLLSYEVVDRREMEDIHYEPTHYRKNERLLALLSRKSPQQFDLFLQALDETSQGHIAQLVRSLRNSTASLTQLGQSDRSSSRSMSDISECQTQWTPCGARGSSTSSRSSCVFETCHSGVPSGWTNA